MKAEGNFILPACTLVTD